MRKKIIPFCILLVLSYYVPQAQYTNCWHCYYPDGCHNVPIGQTLAANESDRAREGSAILYDAGGTLPFFAAGIDHRNNDPLLTGGSPGVTPTGKIFVYRNNYMLRTSDVRHVSGYSAENKLPSYWGLIILGSVLLCIGAIYINIRLR